MEPRERTGVSRRTLAVGAAWSVPALAVAGQTPAFAASPPCRELIDGAFDEAQEYIENQYFCNGQPVLLEINFYQNAAASNGFVATSVVNVKNLSPCNVSFSAEFPLRLQVDVRNANVVNNRRRSVNAKTSWGGLQTVISRSDMNNQPIGTVQDRYEWNFSGNLPGAGLGDNEADLAFNWLDGIAGLQRWNNYLTVTPMMSTGAPSFESTGAEDTAECRAYYEQRLTTWVAPFDYIVRGTKAPYLAPGLPIEAGQTVDTRQTGNHSSVTGSNSTDGIW